MKVKTYVKTMQKTASKNIEPFLYNLKLNKKRTFGKGNISHSYPGF